MGNRLGVNVVPINKPGAGGAVTYTHVKNAPLDGYTVAWPSTSILTTTNIGNVPFKHAACRCRRVRRTRSRRSLRTR